MSRAESRMVMGYLPMESRHHAAIVSLIAPASPATRMLDPFAGEGQFLEVAIKGLPADQEALYAHILAGKANPRPLTVQAEPLYRVPAAPDPGRKFVFSPDIIDEAQGLRLIQEQGAWKTNGFQALLEIPRPP